MWACWQGMEDVGGCEEALLGALQPAVLCSIFDGHCGRGAAEEAASTLPAALAERLPAAAAGLADGSGAAAAWQDAFEEADRSLCAEDGCTATSVLAWLDSRGSICLQVPLPVSLYTEFWRCIAPSLSSLLALLQ